MNETTLATVTRRMNDIDESYSQDRICEAIVFLDFIKETVRAAEAEMKDRVRTWMEANDVREFSIGTVLYYLGEDKKTKCRDVAKALSAALLANGVDPDAAGINVNDIALLLSADAWKHGAFKKLLPQDKFDELFETTVNTNLHVQGAKAARTLQKIDQKFIR